MCEQRGSKKKKGMEDNNVHFPSSRKDGNHVYLFSPHGKDFLFVRHSALILYSLPRRVSLGTLLLYRKQVYSDHIQETCIEENMVFTL